MVKSPNKVQARQVRHIQDIPVDETPNLRERRYSFCFDRERREQKQRRGRGRNKNNDSATLINPPISQYLAWPGRGDKLTADRDPTMPPKQGIYFKKRSLQVAQAGQGSSSDSADDSLADQAPDPSLQFSPHQVSSPTAAAAPVPTHKYANRWRRLAPGPSPALEPASASIAQNTISQFGGISIVWNAVKKVHDAENTNLVPVDGSPLTQPVSGPEAEVPDTIANVQNSIATNDSDDSHDTAHLPLGASSSSADQEQLTDTNLESDRPLPSPAAFSGPAPYVSGVYDPQLMRIGPLYDAAPTLRSQRGKQRYNKNKKQCGKQKNKQQRTPSSKTNTTSANDPIGDRLVGDDERRMGPAQSLNADVLVAEPKHNEGQSAPTADTDDGAGNQHGETNAETFADNIGVDEWPLSFSRSRSFDSLHSLNSQPPSPFQPGASDTASSTQWTVESTGEEICADTNRIIDDRSVSSSASSPEQEPRTPVAATFSGSNDKETGYATMDYDIDAAGDTMMDPGLMDVIMAKDADPAADGEQPLARQQGVKRKRKESSSLDSNSIPWEHNKRTRAARECLNKAIGLLKSIAGETHRATIEALEREYDALYNA
ncbi:hypothetical protein A1Q2_08122 [Trichosporon asahii var. asahii CBS 8904]|uniref:Uncharacterized protein n=1 Tax=Trichosporon asahii var. asahii (strain CBS 8904) TaxID=1220162 RepID=K1V0Z3_TRIAC|nr:hypothetical protein A1Q2_08122 [Trichosporon asahii var. asahii CBS 8904]